jgi:hypothetical protein
VHVLYLALPDSCCLYSLELKGYRSALLFYYKESRREFPVEFQTSLADFFKGLRRKDATERQNGTRRAKPGKEDMAFPVYVWLCRHFVTKGDAFSWAYLTICWNMMCRTNNVAGIKLDHLCLVGDAVGVYTPKTKADQGDQDISTPLSIFLMLEI